MATNIGTLTATVTAKRAAKVYDALVELRKFADENKTNEAISTLTSFILSHVEISSDRPDEGVTGELREVMEE